MKNYRRNRRDANELALITHAKALGGEWVEDPPLDGWVWISRHQAWMPVEIKIPEREGTANEYTSRQLRFFRWCSERRARWFTWRTVADVERDLGARRAA
jgi:hypothetical protein